MKFIHMEITEQVQSGRVAILSLKAVNNLPNLCLYPIMFNPQVGRQPFLIFDFTWIGLNNATKSLALMEVMHFGGALQHII